MPSTPISRRALFAGTAGAVALTGTTVRTAAAALGLNDTMATSEAWSAYLGGLDPVWAFVPTTFYQGPFLGNGGLGAAVYQIGKRLAFTLGDTRVRDHQNTGGTNFGNARLGLADN